MTVQHDYLFGVSSPNGTVTGAVGWLGERRADISFAPYSHLYGRGKVDGRR